MHTRTAAILLSVSLAGAGVFAGTPAFAANRSAIPDSHPRWATAANKAADADPAATISFRVYLNLPDRAGAEAAAQAISSPDSPSYRRYLSNEQVKQRYAPTASSVDQVRGWLSSAGFRIADVAANNLYVEARGSIAQAQSAFGVGLGVYRVRGKSLRAPAGDLSVPASVASLVAGVVGVDQALSLLTPNTRGGADETAAAGRAAKSVPALAPPPAGFRNARPCSEYWAQKIDTTDPAYPGLGQLPYAPCGYKPEQFRAAYGLSDLTRRGLDGRGTTVAIVDAFASPTLYADAAEYAKRNDPAHPLRRDQFDTLVFPANEANEDPCDASGWYGEQSLDVEAVHAMAPGAKILYVGAADCEDLSIDKALNTIVAKNLAQIVSNSYGSAGEEIPADEVQAFQSIAIHAALKGIGLYFSSGDSGDEAASLGAPSPDFSASSPWVTAVGGTSTGIDAKGQRVVETGWETSKSTLTNGVWGPAAYQYGSGGGTSRLFREPFYQKHVVPDALAKKNQVNGQRGRVVPDISMNGDPNTGMLVGQTQTFSDGSVTYGEYRIGGTSLSAPLFAGLMAVSDQVLHARHGFINPAMYAFTSRSGAIRDVRHVDGGVARVDYVNGEDAADGLTTSARLFDFQGLAIHTTPGYDDVTGLGTPAGAIFLLAI
jgi:subtilase family serine protease